MLRCFIEETSNKYMARATSDPPMAQPFRVLPTNIGMTEWAGMEVMNKTTPRMLKMAMPRRVGLRPNFSQVILAIRAPIKARKVGSLFITN